MSDNETIEEELRRVAKVKLRDYPERQDELAALVRAYEKVSDETFNLLSDEAAEWYNEAARAINNNEDIPDFDTSDDHDHEEDEAAASSAGDDTDTAVADADTDSGADDEVNEGSVEEDEPDEPPPEPKKKKAGRPKVAGTSKKKGAAVEEPEAGDTDVEAEDDAKSPAEKVAKVPKHLKTKKTPYDNLSGEKDRYGRYEGTNTSKAIKMYEQGATVRQVFDALGGRYRNILTALAKAGHHVEKREGGVYHLIHKDDYGAKAKGKKK